MKTYRGELGYDSIQDKHYGGDGPRPARPCRVASSRGSVSPRYHKALLISYPTKTTGVSSDGVPRKAGQIPNRVGMGSLIEVHGDGGRGRDWTNGCVIHQESRHGRSVCRVGVGELLMVGGDGSRRGLYTDLIRGRERSKLAKPEADGNP